MIFTLDSPKMSHHTSFTLLRQRYPAAYGTCTLFKVLSLFPGSGHPYKLMQCMALAGTDIIWIISCSFLLLFDFLSFLFVVSLASLRPGYVPRFQDMPPPLYDCGTSYLGTHNLQVPRTTGSLQVFHTDTYN